MHCVLLTKGIIFMLLLINAEEALIRTQKMLRTLEHDELYHNLHCGNKNHKTVKSPRESSNEPLPSIRCLALLLFQRF
ncbi:hypothetical protein RN001_000248 [Aquatica leii]|uniref:Secreted protein n=1 Tax=Aquatica leii TaxID=1421715 RepID=A0AAN7PEL8_9COLE|nr:hypothetical protein RN001_000248 [Aquatica leii]